MMRNPRVFEKVLFSPTSKHKHATEPVEITGIYPCSALPTQWVVTVRVLRNGKTLEVLDCCVYRQREPGQSQKTQRRNAP